MTRLQQKLREHRAELHELAHRHGVSNLRVFGSVARGDDAADSDIDMLVDPGPTTTLFELGAMLDDVQVLLGTRVDLLTPGGLSPRLRERVLHEAQPL
jgi:predicted nucleotidyltransferase